MSRIKEAEAKIVIGAGYGDEGKGRMTDYFAKSYIDSNDEDVSKKILNIRFNGGAQAGHTVKAVKLIDDKPTYVEHVFKQLGSSSFRHTTTYLSKFVTVNIPLLLKEISMLDEVTTPNVIIDEQAQISLPIDSHINQQLENLRGNSRHGSCGFGIYEAFHRAELDKQLTFKDLDNIIKSESKYEDDITHEEISKIASKLVKLQNSYCIERLNEIDESLRVKIEISKEVIYNETVELIKDYAELTDRIDSEYWKYDKFSPYLVCVKNISDPIFRKFDYFIFEGAQGLELSETTKENAPHLTPSNTGVWNTIRIIKTMFDYNKIKMNVEVCYLTRTYKTKHGAGSLPYEEYGKEIEKDFKLYDLTNMHNQWQGTLRYAPLDFERLIELIHREDELLFNYIGAFEKSIAIGHIDQTNGVFVRIDPEDKKPAITPVSSAYEENVFNADRYYLSFGQLSNETVKIEISCKDVEEDNKE